MQTTSIDSKLNNLHTITAEKYNIKIPLPEEDMDKQVKKLQNMTAAFIEENEKKIIPTIMHVFKLILNSLDSAAVIVDENCNILLQNAASKKASMYAAQKGSKWQEEGCFKQWSPSICEQCKAQEALRDKRVITFRFIAPLTNNTYDCIAVPMNINSLTAVLVSAIKRSK